MRILLFPLTTLAISGCFGRPDYIVNFKSRTPPAEINVKFHQRIPDVWGGERDVTAYIGNNQSHLIDRNGRFFNEIYADISEDGAWFRFYIKNKSPDIGRLEYRDVNNDGELDRIWHSGKAENKEFADHHFVIFAYVDDKNNRLFRNNRELGVNTTAENDMFGSKVVLPSSQIILENTINWKPMERIIIRGP